MLRLPDAITVCVEEFLGCAKMVGDYPADCVADIGCLPPGPVGFMNQATGEVVAVGPFLPLCVGDLFQPGGAVVFQLRPVPLGINDAAQKVEGPVLVAGCLAFLCDVG
jgi:hypothetical protein